MVAYFDFMYVGLFADFLAILPEFRKFPEMILIISRCAVKQTRLCIELIAAAVCCLLYFWSQSR